MEWLVDRLALLRRNIMGKSGNKGFTLVEILIVVALIAILTVIALSFINPTIQRHKLYDVKRKRDLNNLKGLYELFFAQHRRFPTADEVCYDSPTSENGVCSCHICGLEQDVGTFSDFLQVLYCDPEHSRKTYLYQYDCTDSPSWYKMYSTLSEVDPEGSECTYGVTNRDEGFLEPYPNLCGLESGGGGGGGGGGPTATPTPIPPACPADPIPKYCRLAGICNICGDFANCLDPATCDQPATLYDNSICTSQCLGP